MAGCGFVWCKFQHRTCPQDDYLKSLALDSYELPVQGLLEEAAGLPSGDHLNPNQAQTLDAVSVPNSRRVRQRLHRTLAYKLAEAAKLRFGCPERDPANLKAVRKHVYDQVQELDINNYDASLAIDRAVALVFVPTDEEIFAADIPRCQTARRRLDRYRNGRREGFMGWICQEIRSIFPDRPRRR